MANSAQSARKWMSWLLTREEIPFKVALAQYFSSCELGPLCDCGCNSFTLVLPDSSSLPALCAPGSHGGMFFELDVALPEDRLLEFLFFCDREGRLEGVDVEVSGNSFPVPADPQIGATVHVWASPSMLEVK